MKNFKWDKKYLYWGITAFSVVVASIIFFSLLNKWSGFVKHVDGIMIILRPFIYGTIIAYLVNHLVRVAEKYVFLRLAERIAPKNMALGKKLSRILSIAVCELAVLAFVASLIVTMLPQIFVSIVDLVNKSQTYVERCIEWAEDILDGNEVLEPMVSEWINSFYEYLISWVKADLLPQMTTLISQITGGVISVIKIAVNLLIGVVISIYLLYSKETFCAQGKKLVYSLFETKNANKVMEELSFVDKAFGDYIAGTLIDAVIIGVVNYIFLIAFGMPYPALISIVLAVTNLIPMFGPFIGAIPCGLIILLESPMKCLIFAIFTVILQQLDGNVIKPRIHSSKTGMSGFWIMFAIIVFGGLFGIVGMIVGVPVMTVLYSFVQRLNNRRLRSKGLPEETRLYAELERIEPDTGEFVYKGDKSSDDV